MDAALNKRASKLKPTAAAVVGGTGVASASVTDSEKILLQLCLDVQSYYSQITEIGVKASDVASLESLLQAVTDGNKTQN
jgi:hypothetical protein